MNRISKFRAWDTYSKSWTTAGLWISMSGDLYDRNDDTHECWCTDIKEATFKDQYILCRFTGLLDKNGKEIYESDLLKDYFGNIREVVFNDGGFWLVHPNGDKYMPAEGIRDIVGNKYEN